MDTVILAAGRGDRLNGIAAPFHKPLLVVNGQPLIRQCVQNAMKATNGSIIVVAAPDNAGPISHVLNGAGLGKVDIILQRHPAGPGHALLTGLKLVTTPRVLVLMGDNVVSADDVCRVANVKNPNVIGVSEVEPDKAERFTRMRRTGREGLMWVEKVPVTDDDIHEDKTICWVGPIAVEASKMEHSIRKRAAPKEEMAIGPSFNDLGEFYTVQVNAIDIGVPEAL